MRFLVQCGAVAGGGALGAVARFLVATACAKLFRTNFPVGTLVINLSGSLFLGWFATVTFDHVPVSEAARLAVAVGFVGAYTTFSTFMYESSMLMSGGFGIKAVANLVGSLVLGLVAVRLGILLGGR